MKKVLILGATGLIGHQIFLRLKARKDYKVISFAYKRKIEEGTVLFSARNEQLLEKKIVEVKPDIIVNSMGVLIAEANRDSESAIF